MRARTATLAPRTSTSRSAPGVTSSGRSSSRRTPPSCCARPSTRRSGEASSSMFSGVTDCYQPLEAKLELTRACLAGLHRVQEPRRVHHQVAHHRARHRAARRAHARRALQGQRQHPVLEPRHREGHGALRHDAAAPHEDRRDARQGRHPRRRERLAHRPRLERRGHRRGPRGREQCRRAATRSTCSSACPAP